MAGFITLTDRSTETSILVNTDKISWIEPTVDSPETVLHLDDEQIVVTESFAEVGARIGRLSP